MSIRTWLFRWILIPLGVVLLRLHALTLRFRIEGEAPVRAAACETIGPHHEDSVIRWILRDAGLDA